MNRQHPAQPPAAKRPAKPAAKPKPIGAMDYLIRRFEAMKDGAERDGLALQLVPFEVAKPKPMPPGSPPIELNLGSGAPFTIYQAASACADVARAAAAGDCTHAHAAGLVRLIENAAKMRWAADLNRSEELRDQLQALMDERGGPDALSAGPGLSWGRHGTPRAPDQEDAVEAQPDPATGMEGW
jgi:hypothetical protein